MCSFRSLCFVALLLLSPFGILAAEHKEVTYTNGSVEEDGKGFLVFKLRKGETDKAECTLVTPDEDKLNFTVAIPDDCSVDINTLFFSYGSCTASIERKPNSFNATGISAEPLYFDAKSDVDFFLDQTHADISGKNAGNKPENDTKPLKCKVQADGFSIAFSFWTNATLNCDVLIKFDNANYKKYVPPTTPKTPTKEPSENSAMAASTRLLIIVGAVVGFVFVVFLIVIVICCCCRRKRDQRTETSAALENEAVLATCISTEEDQSVSMDKAQLHSVTCISKSNEKAKDGTANRRNRNLPPTSSAENQATGSADGKGYDVDKAVHGALGMHAEFVEMRKEHDNRKQKPSIDVKTERATTEKTAAIAPSMMHSLKLATLPSPPRKQKPDGLQGHLKPLPSKEKAKLDATQEKSVEKKLQKKA